MTVFLPLNCVCVFSWPGACLGSRDTSAKVRCSAPAWRACGMCCFGSALHAAGTSCSCELLWSHHSSSSLGSQSCAFEHLSDLSDISSNTCMSGCFFILCGSTQLLATCNTQLGMRHPRIPSGQCSAGVGTQSTLLEWPPSFLSL